MNIKYLRNFRADKKEKNFLQINEKSLTNKQKISLGVLLMSVGYISLFAQGSTPAPISVKTLDDLLSTQSYTTGQVANMDILTMSYKFVFEVINIIKFSINYIVNAQISSAATITGAKFGSSGMFVRITNGITIFAVIACGYKILMHYLKTERYDNVQSFTGFFGYFGILILFLFSDKIVSHIASLNSNINYSAISNVGKTLDAELDRVILADYEKLQKTCGELDAKYQGLTTTQGTSSNTALGAVQEGFQKLENLPQIIQNRSNYYTQLGGFYAGNFGKYLYFSTFALILTSVLAIPAFIMTFMVKVLLSVMLFGTKLVFLLAFIPGFENTWKTFILNLLHILLWVPIFNAIMAFILQIISSTISSSSMSGGQIIWLSIVSIICAYQAVSLTTSAAGTIINGAGAGMAGAMGAMSGMGAASMAGKAISGFAGAAGSAVSGGVGAGVAMSKLKK